MAITRITKGVIKPNENYQAGIVTATGLDVNGNADISGSLYIGGVLTYEDVTNLDSVGIITAQKGIHVGAGVSAVGVGTFGSLDIGGDIDVDGHTNLDNVSIAGVTTTGGITANGSITATRLTISSATPRIYLTDTNNNDDFQVRNENGTFEVRNDTDGYTPFSIASNNTVTVYNDLDINGDLDVDGHTNLDNVSIAGIVTATTFSGSGANLTNLDASDLASGTVPTARLGSGTASSSTFLRGDSTFAAVTSTTINNNADNRLITGSGTANTLEGEANLTYNGTKLSLTGNSASPIVEFINSSGAANEGDVLKLRASGRGGAEDDTDIFLITNNSDTRTFGVSNAGTVNITGSIKMSAGKNINSSGIVTATVFVSDTPLSHRNVIVNGGCLVAQRGTSSNQISNVGVYGSVDRLQMVGANLDQLAMLQKQTSDGPDGFSKCFEFDVTTPENALDADDLVYVRYKVEGQDLEPFFNANGTGKNFTLSFYVKAYQTGTYQINIYKQDGSRFISKTYTISASGVWQRVEIPITGDTGTSGMVQTTGAGFNISWIFAAGSNYTSGSLAPTWGGWPGNSGFAAGHAVNVASSANNYFRITGIQLELGDVATPFEHRTFADELRRCQRYFVKMYGSTGGISNGDGAIATLANFTNTAAYGPIFLPVDMRVAPSPHNPPNYSNLVYLSSGQTFTPSGSQVVFTGAATNRVEIRINSMTNMSAGNAGWLRINSSAGYIEFNAEL